MRQTKKPKYRAPKAKYKTELCTQFAAKKFCSYGERCQFAHGPGEIRPSPVHPRHKTEACRVFNATGKCP